MPTLSGKFIFCDDVREEAEGKSSLMGLFGRKIFLRPTPNFPETPYVLRRLYVVFLADIDDIEYVDVEIKVDIHPPLPKSPPPFSQNVTKPDGEDLWQLKVVFGISDIPISEPTTVIAKAQLGGSKFSSKVIIVPMSEKSEV